jgi:hypothetical protein
MANDSLLDKRAEELSVLEFETLTSLYEREGLMKV